jgi:hypothetical protein
MNCTVTKRMALQITMTAKVLNAVTTSATAMPVTTRLRRQNHGEGQ